MTLEARSTLLRAAIGGYVEAITILETRSDNETAMALIGLMQSYALNGDHSDALATARRAREICQSVSLPHHLETVQGFERQYGVSD